LAPPDARAIQNDYASGIMASENSTIRRRRQKGEDGGLAAVAPPHVVPRVRRDVREHDVAVAGPVERSLKPLENDELPLGRASVDRARTNRS
jgi:hypothetical protein